MTRMKSNWTKSILCFYLKQIGTYVSTNIKNSIRDARTPQPREIFSTPRDIEVLYQYKLQDTFRALSVI